MKRQDLNKDYIIQNGLIEDLTISNERGAITITVLIDYGDGGHQGFGGYCLFNGSSKDYTGLFINECLKCGDVEEWKNLKGKAVRVVRENGKFQALIKGIGHITKDYFFIPEISFKL